MERTEVLLQIKDAEENVEALRAKALAEKEKNIAKAKKDAIQIIEDCKTETNKWYEESLKKLLVELKTEREKLVQKAQTEADELKKSAENNMEAAVRYLVSEFERRIVAS